MSAPQATSVRSWLDQLELKTSQLTNVLLVNTVKREEQLESCALQAPTTHLLKRRSWPIAYSATQECTAPEQA